VIYHFKKFEKNEPDFFKTKKEAISLIIKGDDIPNYPDQDLEKLKTLYGKEAIAIAANLNPFYQKKEISEKEAFIGWKTMNNLALIAQSPAHDNEVESFKELAILEWSLKTTLNKKNHTYIAALFTLIKLLKSKSQIAKKDIEILKQIVKPIAPYFYKNY
jgi:hypothetical protein